MQYFNFEDSLRFPSGRTVSNLKKSLKRPQKQLGETRTILLDRIAQTEFNNASMTWAKGLDSIKANAISYAKSNTKQMTATDLANLIKTHPFITQHGIMYLEKSDENSRMEFSGETFSEYRKKQNEMLGFSDNVANINKALIFFNNVEPSLSINFKKDRHSHELKHLASEYLKEPNDSAYLTNGDFILAAIFRGFFIQTVTPQKTMTWAALHPSTTYPYMNIDEASIQRIEAAIKEKQETSKKEEMERKAGVG